MSSSSAARANEPRSATRTNTRIASNWSTARLFRKTELRATIEPVYRSSGRGRPACGLLLSGLMAAGHRDPPRCDVALHDRLLKQLRRQQALADHEVVIGALIEAGAQCHFGTGTQGELL